MRHCFLVLNRSRFSRSPPFPVYQIRTGRRAVAACARPRQLADQPILVSLTRQSDPSSLVPAVITALLFWWLRRARALRLCLRRRVRRRTFVHRHSWLLSMLIPDRNKTALGTSARFFRRAARRSDRLRGIRAQLARRARVLSVTFAQAFTREGTLTP